MPPAGREAALTRWKEVQVRTAIYALLVVIYYVGVAGTLGGGALILAGSLSIYRANEELSSR